ncbi:DUF6344 domain-containing protein [Streptomyces sp. NPDC057757]|uniref:DUF6344 domain-containing protein n=1 Tax=Streptomyces sp. NPDC057757 TaxID=3346241 RepID=UPI0036CB4449
MARNQVMKLWTAIVTLLVTLCTAAGFITTTAAAAVPQPAPVRNTETPVTTVPTVPLWSGALDRGLPPTMKQRIRAEAHGSSPSCRHRPPLDTNEPEAADLSAITGSTAENGSTSADDCLTGAR